MIKVRVPLYVRTAFSRFEIAPSVNVHMMEVIDFLKWLVARSQTRLTEYLEKMDQNPFFLIAASNLDAATIIPVHLLIRQIQHLGQEHEPEPRVWIVGPRDPTALNQATRMNLLWSEHQLSKGRRNAPPMFGSDTPTLGSTNPAAPVRFVTAEIFEMMAKNGQFTPVRDRVIINEARATIEQNPGIELGIVLTRSAGVTVDYMSVAVDTIGLSDALGVTIVDTRNDGSSSAHGPIDFPLRSSSLMSLAYYLCQQGWTDIDTQVADLDLPSAIHESPERMAHLRQQIATLHELGVAHQNQLTPLGVGMEKWVGVVELAYAAQLQRFATDGLGLSETIFWVVSAALSKTPIKTLRAQYDHFVDRDGSHSELPHSIDVWSHPLEHEDTSAFTMIAQVASLHLNILFGTSEHQPSDVDMLDFRRWCAHAGVSPYGLLQAAQAIQETWSLFSQINGDTEQYRALFGNVDTARLGSLPWRTALNALSQSESWRQLYKFPDVTTIQLTNGKDAGVYSWTDATGERSGVLFQDDTPLPLRDALILVATLTPSRNLEEGGTAWSLSHLGILEGEPETTPKQAAEPEPKTRPHPEMETVTTPETRPIPNPKVSESAPEPTNIPPSPPTTNAQPRKKWWQRIVSWFKR